MTSSVRLTGHIWQSQLLSVFRMVYRIAGFRCGLMAENLRAIFPRSHKTCSGLEVLVAGKAYYRIEK